MLTRDINNSLFMSLLLTMLTVLSANLIGIESQWRSPLGGATVAYFLIRSVDWRVSLWRRLWINTGRRWNFSWTCLFIAEWYNSLLFVFFYQPWVSFLILDGPNFQRCFCRMSVGDSVYFVYLSLFRVNNLSAPIWIKLPSI